MYESEVRNVLKEQEGFEEENIWVCKYVFDYGYGDGRLRRKSAS